jgi:hypothetical protein
MMRDGVVYELPMQAHPTTGSESLSSPTLLRTTQAHDSKSGQAGAKTRASKGHQVFLGDQVADLIAEGLLPTPNTMEHREIKTPEQIEALKVKSPGGYRNLREVVINELPEDSLLRTPSVTDGTGGAISETQARERGRMVKVADQVAELAFENDLKVSDSIAASLLPTPAVAHVRNHDEPVENYLERRAKFESGEYRGMSGVSLGVAVRMNLLMTPVATEGLKAPAQQTSEVKGKNGQVWLSNQAKDMEISWGKFEPAIRRWEAITRPAPAPTKPDGKDGNHRLSAEFTEWMMGLPEGWVTSPEIGLKRNDQLKACGNGVVPQQAEMALRILIDDQIMEQLGK